MAIGLFSGTCSLSDDRSIGQISTKDMTCVESTRQCVTVIRVNESVGTYNEHAFTVTPSENRHPCCSLIAS